MKSTEDLRFYCHNTRRMGDRMGMKKAIFLLALSSILAMAGANVAQAEIQLTDWLSLTGNVRYELGVHTGSRNPYNTEQTENNDFNFSREFFQTELTAKPTDNFKVFAKIRLMADQTDQWDDALHDYDAFPIDVPENDWTMMKVSNDESRAEVWELYADLTCDKLWLRAGRQQIVWGEMISTRILDIINPIDMTRNFLFDPEEFENIRIPEWSIRGRYQFGIIGPLSDAMVEAFVIPGDVMPNQYADFGSPFYLGNGEESFPPFFRFNDQDRRGDVEWGARVGGMLRDIYFTLNYMRLYNNDFLLQTTGVTPDPVHGVPLLFPPDFRRYAMLIDKEYPLTDVLGLTANYFIAPFNTVVTFEGTWTPDQPYQDAKAFAARSNDITDQGTGNYAIRLDRQTFVFPRPTSAMMIQFQFSQTVREGDEDDILGPENSEIDKTDEFITLLLTQNFRHDTIQLSLLWVYDTDDASYLRPFVNYKYGDHWYFDLYTVYCSGSETRPGRFGGIDWVNETVGRITYQF